MKLIKHIHSLWNKSSHKTRQRIVIIFAALVIFNILVWIFGFIFTRIHPILLGLITIAYCLGLRHAVDADHIAAIDNTTRKLMSEGKKPVATGLFFSLGH